MSKITKFFQVTNQMLLSYEYNQWNSIGMAALDGSDSLTYHNIFLYKQLDGNYALLDNPESTLENQNNNILNTKFGDTENSDYYYIGYFTGQYKDKKDVVSNDFVAKSLNSLYNKNHILAFDSNTEKAALNIDSSQIKVFKLYQEGQCAYDSIKIYLLTGFVFNNIQGISIKVKAPTKNNLLGNYKNDYVTLLNYVFLKDRLQDKVTWMSNPLYMNSKFYDRYIEIKVPDAYYLGTNNNVTSSLSDLMSFLNIDPTGNLIIEFSSISEENLTSISQNQLLNNTFDYITGTSEFTLDPIVSATLKPKSNTDLFNIRIYEDQDNHNIIYYPVYGEGTEAIDFNIDVMYNIENGRIPFIETGFYDEDEDYDEFIDQYGISACRWMIINELSITYEYTNIYINTNDDLNNVISSKTEIFSNTIDYSNKTSSDGQFWRQKFIPHIQENPGQVCTRIIINYVCRLQNRLNGAEVIRSGGLIIDNAESKYNDDVKFINVSNINKWKIINKLDNSPKVITNSLSTKTTEKYIRTYYENTDIIIQDVFNNVTATQGQLTLKLYKTTNNYNFRLYNMNSQNIRVPHDLTGPYNYKLKFPLLNNATLEIDPIISTTESTSNLGIGSLLFRITDEQVKNIMSVTSENRYFAIICNSNDSSVTSSTLYEGKVSYL